MEIVYESANFKIEVPDKPFVSREEGGHIRLTSKISVTDRTLLTREQAIEYTKLSMIIGEGLTKGLAERGVDVGIVNYQEMGNWSVFKPGGPIMHMHIFGRAKTAVKQKYGEAVKLPFRDTGFYDDFLPLDEDDITAIKKYIVQLLSSERYQDF